VLSRQLIIDSTLDMVKTVAHRLYKEVRGAGLNVIIPNSGGMEPDIIITFKGLAYHDRQIDAQIDIWRNNDFPNGQYPIHIDVLAFDTQNPDLDFYMNENLESFDEIGIYIDKIVALYRDFS
jgi:hypothetical protein